MLPVPVKLDRIAVSHFRGIFHSVVKAARKPQVLRKIHGIISPAPANDVGSVRRAVRYYDVIERRIVADQLVNDPLNAVSFVISGNDQQYITVFLSFRLALFDRFWHIIPQLPYA